MGEIKNMHLVLILVHLTSPPPPPPPPPLEKRTLVQLRREELPLDARPLSREIKKNFVATSTQSEREREEVTLLFPLPLQYNGSGGAGGAPSTIHFLSAKSKNS